MPINETIVTVADFVGTCLSFVRLRRPCSFLCQSFDAQSSNGLILVYLRNDV